jgi:hypothetical protein
MKRAGGNSSLPSRYSSWADGVVWPTSNDRPEGDKFSNTGIMSPSSSWAVECRLRR